MDLKLFKTVNDCINAVRDSAWLQKALDRFDAFVFAMTDLRAAKDPNKPDIVELESRILYSASPFPVFDASLALESLGEFECPPQIDQDQWNSHLLELAVGSTSDSLTQIAEAIKSARSANFDSADHHSNASSSFSYDTISHQDIGSNNGFDDDRGLAGQVEHDLDQVEQLLASLDASTDANIVLHGTDGTDRLGSKWMFYGSGDNENVNLHHLGMLLDEAGSTQVYGCGVSNLNRGETLLEAISAAVADHTSEFFSIAGHESHGAATNGLGADSWSLSSYLNEDKTLSALNIQSQSSYDGLLASFAVARQHAVHFADSSHELAFLQAGPFDSDLLIANIEAQANTQDRWSSSETLTLDSQTIVRDGQFAEASAPALLPGYTSYTQGSYIGQWQVESGVIDLNGNHFVPSPTGGRSIEFMAGDEAGGIVQAISTVPGQTYQITFSIAGNWRNSFDVSGLHVEAGSNSADIAVHLKSEENAGVEHWQTRTFTFDAVSNTTTLKFAAIAEATVQPAILSDIHVTELPADIATALASDTSLKFNPVTGEYFRVNPSDWQLDGNEKSTVSPANDVDLQRPFIESVERYIAGGNAEQLSSIVPSTLEATETPEDAPSPIPNEVFGESETIVNTSPLAIVLIDSQLQDSLTLQEAVYAGSRLFVYDSSVDSAHDILQRVTDWVASHGGKIESLSILSHGAAGGFELGHDWITNASLGLDATDWRSVANYMAEGSQIYLFGCNVASTPEGQALLDELASITSANVYASRNVTGVGGDWILEESSQGSSAYDATSILVPLDIELLEVSDASLAWYNTNWGYRKQITIDHTKVSATQTNFSVLVNLASDTDLQSRALANGNDLVFTSSDGTTKLDYEIESYSSVNGQLVAWIRIPSLSSVSDTTIYLYYGNASATNQQNATGVYDANTMAVYHLGESAGPYADSTVNPNTSSSGTSPTQTTGEIGKAQAFNGSTTFIGVANATEIALTSNATVSAWIKLNATGQADIIEKGGNGGYTLWLDGTKIAFGKQATATNEWAYSTTNFTTGVWYKIDGVNNAGTKSIYVNGTLEASSSVNNSFSNTNTLKIGDGLDGFLNGTIDEVNIDNVARSASWIATEFNNQSSPSSFYAVTAEQVQLANVVPGSQTVTEDTNLVFSSGNGNQLSINDLDPTGSLQEVTLTVTNGTLTLNGTAGLTFTTGDGTTDNTMTFRGSVASINAALNGLSYTPTANYNGSASLTMTTIDSSVVTLEVDTAAAGSYAFEGNANDIGPGTAQNGTLVGSASIVTDGTRGQVVSLDGSGDYVQIAGVFSNPTNVTIGGWVNLTSASGRSEFISLNDRVHIALDETGKGVKGSVQTAAGTWVDLASNRFIAGTGWHHVMYVFDDTNNTNTLYIDGAAVATATIASSVYYTSATTTYIGSHPSLMHYLNGYVDDVFIFNRALSTTEVGALANDRKLSDTDSVSISITAVNDAPTVTSGASITMSGTNEDTNSAPITVASLLSSSSYADADASALSGIAVTTKSASGTWQYSTDGTNWTSFGSVTTTNALLLTSSTQVRLAPDARNAETATFAFKAWDQTSGTASAYNAQSYVDTTTSGGSTAFSTSKATATVVVTGLNDAPVLADTALTLSVAEDAGAPTGTVGSLVSSYTGGITDVDTGAVKGIAITASVETNGTWYYTTNGGTSWTALGTVSSASSLLLADDANTRIYFSPGTNYNGTANAALTIRGWDQTSGTVATKVNTTTNGTTSAFSSSTDVVDVTVTSVNDAPVSFVDTATAVEAGGANNATTGTNPTGNVLTNDTDVDSGDTKTVSGVAAGVVGSAVSNVGTSVTGTYGAINIASTGAYTYTVDNNNVTVQALRSSASTITDVFTYTMQDALGATSTTQITVTIQGANDTPTAVLDTVIAIEAGGTANGTAGTNPTGNVLTNDTDVDAGESQTVSGVAAGVVGSASTNVGSAVTGTFGSINIASNGAFTYTVDNSNATVQALRTSANTVNDVFTYTMRDTAGQTSTTQVTVTIQGANDTPNITSSSSYSVNETENSVATIVASDVDSGTTFNYAIAGGADASMFTINSSTGALSFVSAPDYETPLDVGGDSIYNVTVQASDGFLATTQAIAVTVLNVSSSLIVTTAVDNNDAGITTGANYTSEWLNAHKGADGLVSLREAIFAANNTTGTDTISFSIPVGATGYTGTSGVDGRFVINLASALPNITESVVLDGTTQTSAQGDTNVGYLGSGGTVGVDGLTLSQVARPEIEIVGSASITTGFDVNASNVTIRGFAMRTFTSEAILLRDTFSGSLIEQNILGSGSTAIADPGVGFRTAIQIRDIGADNVTIQNNIIGFADSTGIFTSAASNGLTIINNEIVSVGIGSDNADGIALGSSNNTVIRGNRITGTSTQAIILSGTSTTTTIENNTITGNGVGATGNAPVQNDAIAARSGTSDATIYRNIIADNYGSGIAVNNGASGIKISQNSIYGNGTITSRNGSAATGIVGIDLQNATDNNQLGTAPYYTSNDTGDGDAGGNALQNFPILNVANSTGTAVTLGGTLNSFANRTYRVEFFANPTASSSGYGVGKRYLGFVDVTTDGVGNVNFSTTLGVNVTSSDYVSATATDLTTNNTSELGLNLAVNQIPVANDDNGYYVFDGTDDLISVTGSSSLTMTNAMTIEAWVNPTASANAQRMIVNKEGEYEVAIDVDGSIKWAFANTSPGWAWHDTNVVIVNGTWSAIAITYSAGTVSTYVNGELVESFVGSGSIGDAYSGQNNFTIGGRTNSPSGQYFAGSMDDVRIWNIARTETEIRNSLGNTLTGSESGLVGYWQFNEASGTTVYDSSLLGNTGVLGGGVVAQQATHVNYETLENATLSVGAANGVLSNDIDLDGDTKTVTKLNGNAGAIGSPTSIASGALVTLNSDGSYTYNTSTAFDYLLAGATATDTFTYTVSDSLGNTDTATVTVYLTGVNDNPNAVFDTVTAIEAAGIANGTAGTNPSGNVLTNDTDADVGDTKTVFGVEAGMVGSASSNVGSAVIGTYGSINIASNGAYTYTVDNTNSTVQALRTSGQTITDVFTYTMKDAAGVSSTTQITVTIQGANDTPTAIVDTATAVEAGGTANGTAGTNPTGNVLTNDTDIDSGDTKTVSGVAAGVVGSASTNVGSEVTGSYGSINISSTGTYTYSVDNANSVVQALRTSANTLTDVFTYTLTDAAGATNTTQITITVQGANDAPNDIALVGSSGTNLVTNGSFEANSGVANNYSYGAGVTVSGWTPIGGEGFEVWNNFNDSGPGAASAGNTLLELDVTSGLNGLSQNIATAAGQKYLLSFDFSGRYTAASSSVEVYWQDQLIGTVTNSAVGWQTFSFVLTGSGGADNLKFMELAPENDSGGSLLDNVRLIADQSNTISVAENTPDGTIVARAGGSDFDTISKDTITYSLTNNSSGAFAINSTTGEISVANSSLLDFETTPTRTIVVRATDASGATLDKTFILNLTNANEAPTAVADNATAVEAGGTANGTAGTNPTGNLLTNDTDPDAGDTKSVSGVAAGVVGSASTNVGSNVTGTYGSINISSTGAYSYTVDNSNATVQALRTSSNTLTDVFSYTMTDAGGLTNTTQITVTIQGANDTPSDITGALSIAENSANTSVVGTVAATDIDSGDGFTYALTNSAGGRFAVNSSTGQVTVADSSLLDYEASSTHSITVQVTDTDGATFSKVMTVSITNVNESPIDLVSERSSDQGVTINTGSSNNQYFTASGGAGLLGGLGDFTVSATVSTTSAVEGYWLSYETATNGNALLIGYQSSQIVVYVNSNLWATGISASSVTDGQSHEWIVSRTASTGAMSLYIDGRSVASTAGLSTGQTLSSGGSLMFGQEQDSVGGGFQNNQVFKGTYSDIAVYNTAWSTANVASKTGSVPSNAASDVIAHWSFDSLSSGQVTDAVGGRTLTLGSITPDVNWIAGSVATVGAAAPTGSIAENSANGTQALLVTAVDRDPANTFSYSLTSSAGGRFAINSVTGMVTVADSSLLNFEAATSHNITVRATDQGGLTYDEIFTINLTDVNETPTAVLDTATSVEAGGVANGITGTNPTGNVLANDTDPDASDTKTVSGVASGVVASASTNVGSSVAGSYGAINIASNGTYTYTVDNSNATVQALRTSGQTITDVFSYTMTDIGGLSSTTQITVTIQGANDAPTAVFDAATAVEAGGLANITAGTNPTGNVLTNDVDPDSPGNGETKTIVGVLAGTQASASGNVASAVAGTYGSINITSTGSYSYTVDNSNATVQSLRTSGQTITDVFTYTVSDTAGATSSTQITVTIQGANDAPTAVVDTATAVEAGGTSNGTAGTNPTGNVLTNDTDTDSSANGETQTVVGVLAGTQVSASGNVAASVSGTYGSINIAAYGSYSYTIDNNNAAVQALRASSNTLTDVFTYTMTDAAGVSSTARLSVTVQGANDAPTDVVAAQYLSTLTPTATNNTYSGVLNDIDHTTNSLVLDGVTYARGLGMHAPSSGVSTADYAINGATTFRATIGINDYTTGNYGTVIFRVYVDGNLQYTSNTLTSTSAPIDLAINTTGGTTLRLEVDNAGNGNAFDHADWFNARLEGGTIALAVAENSTNGTVVGSVNRTDVDWGDNATYTLLDSAGGRFAVSSTTGLITVADGTLLNYEANTSHTIVVRATDVGGLFFDKSMIVTVGDINEAPVALADSATAIEAGGVSNGSPGTNPSGNVLTNDTDVDAGDTKTVSGVAAGIVGSASSNVGASVTGTYGSINIATNGAYTYTVDNTNATVQALRTSGQTITDVFTYTMMDAAGSTSTTQITVTIQGANDTPTSVVDTATAVEAGGVANGTAGANPTGNVLSNDTDVDSTGNGETKTIVGIAAGVSASASGSVGASVTGAYGSIQIAADGTYSYTVDNANSTVQSLRTTANTLDDVFTYTMTDAAGATSTTQIAVTIQGANDTPTITSNGGLATAAVSIAENTTAVTTVVGNDADAGTTLSYSIIGGADSAKFSINGSNGTLAFVTAQDFENPTDIGLNNVYDVTIQVSDGSLVTTQAIAVTVFDVSNFLVVTTATDNNDSGIATGGSYDIEWLNAHKGSDDAVSLREAIIAANNTTGTDTVNFSITGTGLKTISLGSALPSITDTIVLNGYSQTGASANTLTTGSDAVFNVAIDGTSAGAGVNGLTLASGSAGSTITGLAIGGFSQSGIYVASDNNTLSGNMIGLNASGTTAIANTVGVTVSNGTNNTIGGTSASARNIISGNSSDGIVITGATAANNAIKGNYIGTDATGSIGLGNGGSGINIASSAGMNTIGGNTSGAGNVISGNTSYGVYLAANDQTVQGNIVGLNASGTSAIANSTGIYVNSSTNLIGGTSALARNVISGNTNNGLALHGDSNTVQGNYIGTNSAGTAAIANFTGVFTASSNNQIGGTSAGARNVISGNSNEGIFLNGSSNAVQGNYIGLNAAGTAAIANTYGVTVNSGSGNTIGGTSAAVRNIISGNSQFGVNVQGNASGTIIQGNYIGTNVAGTAAIGNSVGVYLGSTATTGATVGGTAAGASNIISGNNTYGVVVFSSNDTIQGNYIGTNVSGTGAVANGNAGIYIGSGATNTSIGGTTSAARNIISGNANAGIFITGTTGSHTIQGNYIGVDSTGDTALGNSSWGIRLDSGSISNVQIGGTAAGAGNVISGNASAAGGILVNAGTGATIEGNRIGIGATTNSALGTVQGTGVQIASGSSNTRVGGTTAASANIIAYNGTGGGVTVTGNASGNTIQRNAIYGNSGLAIDLGANGSTTNDGALTTGQPNQLMDTPVLSNANLVGNNLTLSGYVGSAASQSTFANSRVEFYKTTATNSIFLGFLTTDASGNFSGTLDVTGLGLSQSDIIIGTATDPNGNTSEFSASFQTNAAPSAVSDTDSAVEAGGVNNGTSGSNSTGNVLSNDTDPNVGDTKTVIGVAAGVSASASGNVGSVVSGSYGTLTLAANGAYTYNVDNTNSAVQALRTSGQTLSDSFTYTMTDAGGLTSSTQIAITIYGANDTPTAVADTPTAIEAGGLNNSTAGTNPTGNVLSNDTDVDAGDTKTVSGVIAGVSASVSGSVGSIVSGTYGSIQIASDGTYTYSVDNTNSSVQALRTSSQTLQDVFSYTVTDTAGATSTTQVTITIQGANDTPTASSDNANATEAGGLSNSTAGVNPTGNVLANDTDLDSNANGETKTIAGVVAGVSASASGSVGASVAGSYGSIQIAADGTYTYTVDNTNTTVQALRTSGQTLTDVFTYTMTDTAGLSSTAQITVTIGGANDNPTATNDIGNATEAGGIANAITGSDPTGNVLTNDGDVDAGDTQTVTGVAAGVSASVSGSVGSVVTGNYGTISIASNGSYSYTVDNSNSTVQALRTSGQTINDVFTYTMVDTAGAASTAQVTIVISGANDAPVATADTATATEQGGINNASGGSNPTGNVLSNDTDVDSNANGETKTIAGVVAGVSASASGSVGANVAGSYGSIQIAADGTYTYTVDNTNSMVQALRTSGQSLTDVYTYTVVDTAGLSSTTQITITITGANDAPVATTDNVAAIEASGYANGTVGTDPTANVLTNDSDVDSGDTKTVTGVAVGIQASAAGYVGSAVSGSYGTVTIGSDGALSYVVDNANSAVQALHITSDVLFDVFSYTVTDTAGATSTTQVTVTVHGANDAPTGVNDSATAVEAGGISNGSAGSNATGNVLTNDTDVDSGDTKTVIGVVSGASASASGSVGSPITGQYGSITVASNGTYAFTVDNTNAAVQALRTSSQTLSEVFTYTMTDTDGLSSTATLTITIQGQNDAPVAVGNTASAQEAGGVANTISGTDPTGNVLTNDTDVDSGDTKTVTGVALGVQASASGNIGSSFAGNYGALTLQANGSYSYSVDNNNTTVEALRTGDTLTETFTYTVTDTAGATSSTTLVITIHGADDLPFAVIDINNSVEAGGVNNNSNGTSPTGNVFTNDITPNGSTLLGVVAGVQGSASGQVNQAVTGDYGSIAIDATGNYSYTLNNALSAVEALRVSGDHLFDIFTYTFEDMYGYSTTTQVTIVIDGKNDNPVSADDLSIAIESGGLNNGTAGSDATGNVLSNDSDVDSGDTKNVIGLVAGATSSASGSVGTSVGGNYGAIVVNADGSYSYTVNNSLAAVQALRSSSDTLTDVFTYSIEDTAGATSTATLTITIQGQNDNPLAVFDTAVAVEAGGASNGTAGTNPTGNVLTNDTDVDGGDSKTVLGVASGVVSSVNVDVGNSVAGTYGAITINSNGTYSYVVDNNNATVQALRTSGETVLDVFTYSMVDSAGAVSTTQITITIQGANDAPVMTSDNTIAVEAGGYTNATPGFNPTGNVLTNDYDVDGGDSLAVSGVASGVSASASGSVGSAVSGSYGSIQMNADGSYSYTVNNSNAAVQALRLTSETLDDVFTYSVQDASGAISTTLLTVTIQGQNDAPVSSNDTSNAYEAGGVANATVGSNATGSVLGNDVDVDTTDTVVVSAVAAGATTPIGGVTQSIGGLYGSLVLNSDGSYSYSIDENNAAVQALRLTSQTLNDVFSYTITDAIGLESTSQLTIVLHGTNDAPVAGNDSGLATEAGGLANSNGGSNATGNVLANDTDVDSVANGETKSVSGVTAGVQASAVGSVNTSVAGAYGAIAIAANGSYTYTINDSNAAVQALRTSGQTLQDVFTYTVTDAAGASSTTQVTITIQGSNDNPVAVVDNGSAIEAGGIGNSTSGSNATGNVLANDTDVDSVANGETKTVTGIAAGVSASDVAGSLNTTVTGSYGSLVLQSDGSYDYAVDDSNTSVQALRLNGQTLNDVFTYTQTDAGGLTSTTQLTITIHGRNDTPVGMDDTVTAVEASGYSNATAGSNPTGNVLTNDTDADSSINGETKNVSGIVAGSAGSASGNLGTPIAGTYGSLTMQANGGYAYSVNNSDAAVQGLRTSSDTLQDLFTYSVLDASGATSLATLTVTIEGRNDAPFDLTAPALAVD